MNCYIVPKFQNDYKYYDIFTVHLTATSDVLDLRNAIKSVKSYACRNVDVNDLGLRRTSIPIDSNFEESIGRLKLQRSFVTCGRLVRSLPGFPP